VTATARKLVINKWNDETKYRFKLQHIDKWTEKPLHVGYSSYDKPAKSRHEELVVVDNWKFREGN